jgi:hypothetical protein
MDGSYRQRNDATREQLAALVRRLRPGDLDLALDEGWTVRAALMHLAFWDRFAAVHVEEWQRTGFQPALDDANLINLAALNDWLAAPTNYVVREVVAAAGSADRCAAAVDDTSREAIAAGDELSWCERSVHRAEHIEQIEAALAAR